MNFLTKEITQIFKAFEPLKCFSKAIVDGIRFSYKKDGSVWLQNRMKYPVFVTSGYLDEQSGGLKKDKVHKVYGCASIKTFGFNVSKQIIRDALLSKQMATMYLQGKLTPMNYIYEKKTQEELRRVILSVRFCLKL